jgi:putative ABC transport system permease protein
MRYFPLIWAALWRKPVRAVLTLLSVTVAFTLFGLLIGFKASFDHVQDIARADRIYVNPRFAAPFTEAMAAKLASVPGVKAVATFAGVGGFYQNQRNRGFVMMTDPAVQKVWPELPLTPQQYGALAANRTGIFVSRTMAQHLGIQSNRSLPLTSPAPRADGAKAWTFQVLGIVDDLQTMPAGFAIGNLAYYDEARPAPARGTGVGFRLLVNDPANGETMARRIDQTFANSGTPTRSITEKSAYDTSGSGIDIPFLTESIAGAGLFMILFLTGNSIAQSVRERIPEFAVLKTIGFTDQGVVSLVFAEAALLCLLGAFIGLGIARAVAAVFPKLLPPGVGLPPPYLPPSVLAVGILCAAVVAALSAALPATRISRLDVATALFGRT